MEQTEKKRGKFLSGWLIFLAVINSISLPMSSVVFILVYNTLSNNAPIILTYTSIILLNIIFGRAAWQWKKWGVWGLGIMAVLAAVTSAFSFYFLYLSPIEVVGIVFLIIKVLPVWHYFTWR